MTAYDMPTSLNIGGVDMPIRYGWRAVLDILIAQNDPELNTEQKLFVMLQILYPRWRDIPKEHIEEAAVKACEFIDCGQKKSGVPKPRTMDWEQDAAILIPAINERAGKEVRADPNMHWWTFFGYYMSIGESLFSSILRIRSKRAQGKKLEKWEQEFAKENKHLIEMKAAAEQEEIRQEKQDILKWL